ncbi:hypothetical protein NEMIN01_2454 [Nematocida minor]|uniref:uncharacterized protein n=1 Tax=Nematocida minor TaxID=1912983 RepID=UPI0022207B6A|nr:uncharacterized protein NEMIN01_2454 [Nematocida minor]KAI5193293.1 hypothetical protein NEMIN01_2454 [Nematocida minor]
MEVTGIHGRQNYPYITTEILAWIPLLQENVKIGFHVFPALNIALVGYAWINRYLGKFLNPYLQLQNNNDKHTHRPTETLHTKNQTPTTLLQVTEQVNIALETPEPHKTDIEEKTRETSLLTPELKQKLIQMITDSTKQLQPNKAIKDVQYKMTLTSNKPIFLKSYPVPDKYKDTVLTQLQNLKERHIIEEATDNAFASPAFIIPKKNGKHRLVVDYRQVNTITADIACIFPDIYTILREIPYGNKYFTQIDLKDGYHQIEMHPDSKPYTGFAITGQHYIYNRMPFGLKNAPAYFQKIIYQRIGDLPFVKVFLDDILIYSPTAEEHLQHIQQVLTRFQRYNIILNIEKSNFFQSRVIYLGNIISEKGIQADTQKLDIFKKSRPPKTAKELMSLIGTINWFRPYIPNLSIKLGILNKKLKGGKREDIKKNAISWSPEDEECRQDIFNTIQRQIVLSNPDPTKSFHLFTDACETGIGAILTQTDRIIGLYSKTLIQSEMNYTTKEKELFAIIKALEHFRIQILGRHIIVHTDHRNLLTTQPLDKSRSERWKIMTLEYDIQLEHIAGKNNTIADYLSRAENKIYTTTEQLQTTNTDSLTAVLQQMSNTDDIKERIRIIAEYLGHPGTGKLYRTLKIHWPGNQLLKEIKKYRRNCISCQQNIIGKAITPTSLGTLSTATPFTDISSDIFGPFTLATNNRKYYIITITDRCTRWSEIAHTKLITAQAIIKQLQQWINTHPKPITILHDRGLQYTSKETQEFLKQHNIRSIHTTPYNPTGNSISERINQEIKFILSHDSTAGIKSAINKIHRRLNYTYHTTLQCTPFELVHQYHPLDPQKKTIDIHEKLANIQKRIHTQQELSKQKRNNIQRTPKIGDEAYYKNYTQGDKLSKRWQGPCIITNINSSGTQITLRHTQHNKEITCNPHQLRLA